MKLSVLICTVTSRVGIYLPEFIKRLNFQAEHFTDVEILYLGDNKKRTVGEKRNDLISIAKGEYIVFCDDDDIVSDDYVSEIRNACDGSDIVVFDVMCSVNGGEFKLVKYDKDYSMDKNFAAFYQRIPNHIMCIRRDIALKVMFRQITFGEDADYAKRIKRYLITQNRINKVLYYYIFNHKTSETQ